MSGVFFGGGVLFGGWLLGGSLTGGVLLGGGPAAALPTGAGVDEGVSVDAGEVDATLLLSRGAQRFTARLRGVTLTAGAA